MYNKLVIVYSEEYNNALKSNNKIKPYYEYIKNYAKYKGFEVHFYTVEYLLKNFTDIKETLILCSLSLTSTQRNFVKSMYENENALMYQNEEVFQIANDKYLTYLFLKKHNIKTPKTKLLNISKLKNEKYPFVIKKRNSSNAKDVFLITSKKQLQVVLSKNKIRPNIQNQYIVQEYIKKTHGKSIRTTTLNSKDYYVYKIQNKSFCSNVSKGGKVKSVINKQKFINNTKKIVEIFQKEYDLKNIQIGVDFTNEFNPQIFEINAFPGYYGLRKLYKYKFLEDIFKK